MARLYEGDEKNNLGVATKTDPWWRPPYWEPWNMYGYDGDDILIGGDKNDLLDGGPGADQMYGGKGNDRYIIDNISDQVVEYAGQGYDYVYSSISYTLGANVEYLQLQGTAANGYGNNLSNIIVGNEYDNQLLSGAGNDHLHSNGGNDLLDGGPGADRMVGGKGDDYYYVENTGDSVEEYELFTSGLYGGNDTVLSFLESYTLPEHIENLRLYQYGQALYGYGNELNNSISGNSHNNFLGGKDGNDYLHGEGGNDVLLGDKHSDILLAGEGNDVLVGAYDSNSVEYDILRGDGGADTFYISSYYDSYYLSDGYASILDFDRLEGDKIYAGGASSSNYTLIQNQNFSGGSALDTKIYYDGNLVAVAVDTTNVSIANDFIFS